MPKTISEKAGRTSLRNLSYLVGKEKVQLLAKLEGENPSGSVKDRAIAYILERAQAEGKLNKKNTITELTVGTTGVAAAWAAQELGYACEIMSSPHIAPEKKEKIEFYGGKVIFPPEEILGQGILTVFDYYAHFLEQGEGKYFPLNQFSNPLFARAYELTIVPEILSQLRRYGKDNLSLLVAGVGTGSTLMGVSQGLRKIYPHLHTVAVEPTATPDGLALWENIDGLRNTKVMHLGEKDTYDPTRATSTAYVTKSQAEKYLNILVEAGIKASASSGAVFYASRREAEKITSGNIVMLFCDGYAWG